MYEFQECRWGYNWVSIDGYSKETKDFKLDDYDNELWGKCEYRLINTDTKEVAKHWRTMPYGESVFIDLKSRNPLKIIFEMYQLDCVTAKHLIELWLNEEC